MGGKLSTHIFFQQVKFEPLVLVHGGAGKADPTKATKLLTGVRLAARVGYKEMAKGGCALDAVEAAIRSMELDDDFNAGYGSVLTIDGRVENDASIMDGVTLKAGCVSLITDILHPISVARKILDKLPYTYMAGNNAMRFAEGQGVHILKTGSLVSDSALKELNNYKNQLNMSTWFIPDYHTYKGTIGAVAIDSCGNLAAGTSAGGSIGKLSGRIGDSSLIGSGTYADNNLGAISVTGGGEISLRYNVAQRIMQNMNYMSTNAQQAAENVLDEMNKRMKATAGVILLDKFGNTGIYFTAKSMPWAYQKRDSLHFGIFKGEHFSEKISSQ